MVFGKVAVVGDINLDIIAFHRKFPKEGCEELAEKAYIRHGGSAANLAHALALQKVKVAMVGCVGNDLFGKMLLSGLEKSGVNVSLVQKTSEDITGIVYIFVAGNGERTMLAYRGANKHLKYTKQIKKTVDKFDAVFFSGYSFLEGAQKETAMKILSDCVGTSCVLSMDLCVPLASRRHVLEETAPLMDIVFMNVDEFKIVSDRMGVKSVRDLAVLWRCLVILKMGKHGCMISTETGRTLKIPAKKINPIDTTGAGDAFAAGFLFEHLEGSHLERCGRKAVELGAKACSVVGGRIDKVFLPAMK